MADTMLGFSLWKHPASRRSPLPVFAPLVLLLFVALPVSAQPTSIKAKERAAKKACSTGDYQKGVDLLADLYLDSNDPTYVFNQARCYQQNEKPEQALGRFHEYLRKVPDLPAKDRVDVNRYVNECEALVAKLHPPSAQPAAEPAPAKTVEAHPVQLTTPGFASPPQNTGRGLRTTGIVTAGVGVVLIGAGVAFNLTANRLADEIRAGAFTRDKPSTRDHYVTLSWVSYGLGAAAVVTGATLYALGWRTNRAGQSDLAVVPVVIPGEAAISMLGSF